MIKITIQTTRKSLDSDDDICDSVIIKDGECGEHISEYIEVIRRALLGVGFGEKTVLDYLEDI